MKSLYKISRIVILFITFLIFNIIFINEDGYWRILPFIFAVIAYGFSFPGTVISKKIITLGNKIKSKLLRVLYYIILPIVLILVSVIIAIGLYSLFENIIPNADLGQAVLFYFFIMVVLMGIMLPYIQTLIVLILEKLKKINNI